MRKTVKIISIISIVCILIGGIAYFLMGGWSYFSIIKDMYGKSTEVLYCLVDCFRFLLDGLIIIVLAAVLIFLSNSKSKAIFPEILILVYFAVIRPFFVFLYGTLYPVVLSRIASERAIAMTSMFKTYSSIGSQYFVFLAIILLVIAISVNMCMKKTENGIIRYDE